MQYNLYDDYGKNIDANLSQVTKDFLSLKHIFVSGDYDYIVYRKATRNWL